MTARMTQMPRWAVQCDRCGRETIPAPTQDEAKNDAKCLGWMLSDSTPIRDLCPDCQSTKWRVLVEKQKDTRQFRELWGWRTPLAAVMALFAEIADEVHPLELNLSRVIAVCEREVGGGWQADPSIIVCTKSSGVCDISCLLDGFNKDFDDDYKWKAVSERAASWLRHVTEENDE